jgi:hypothetical protein
MSNFTAIPNGWSFWDKMDHDNNTKEFALWMSLQPKPETVKEVEEFYGTEVIFTRTNKFNDTEKLEQKIFSLQAKARYGVPGLSRREENRLARLEDRLEATGKVRVWVITLPRDYKVKAGFKVLVTEKSGRIAEFSPVSLRVYVSRLRRLVQPSMLGTTKIGPIPFLGTFWGHLTDTMLGIRCLSTQGDCAKYIRSKGVRRSIASPSI